MKTKTSLVGMIVGAVFFASFYSVTPAAGGVILQGFYRDAADTSRPWWDVLASEANELKRAGFTAVWIPPILKGASGGFSTGYDPFDDYDIGNKDERGTVPTHWGSREQLQRAVAIMRANGLDVYVDMVLNHRDGVGDKHFLYANALGQPAGGRFEKNYWDFHRDDLQDQDRDVPDDDTHFGPDLKHSSLYVANGLIQAGDWLTKALDVQGYRLDYVKGISAGFLRNYLNSASMAGKFAVGEYQAKNGSSEIDGWCRNSMQGRTHALDFPLRDMLKEMCGANGFFDMSRLDHAGFVGTNPGAAVTFVESHDTQDNPAARIVSNKHLAYAYILTSEGYPVVFYRDYYDFGMKGVINNLVWIHERLALGATQQRFKDPDLFAYERLGGAHLLVAINDNQQNDRTITVDTGFGNNARLHDFTGSRGDVWTDGNGKVTLGVPKNGYVAYAPWQEGGEFPVPQLAVTQEFAGAADLDIKPAGAEWSEVGRIYPQQNKHIVADLYFDSQGLTATQQYELKILDGANTVVATASGSALGNQPIHFDCNPASGGWHRLQIRMSSANPSQSAPFWLKVNYTAPQILK